ncbi:competence protein CoiA [Planococcus glaciei]|uniref:competence protein CoiA n=1 Tax=Planococcus glaciei TaxID=459472 RepID=UPI001364A576|nr:competence protein CoiA family protein [Planococcus glaciei]
MNAILVAKTSTNRLIYLHPHLNRERLVHLRASEQFFCPSCGESLLLKIGNIKIPHFSHTIHSECATFSESESPMHLHGKTMLHTFFTQKNHHAELEKYFPIIRQRADLVIDQRFAVEFQCSPIPVQQIKARTEGYLEEGIQPLWLLSAKSGQTEGIQIIKLKSYERALIQQARDCSFLLSFDPMANRFYYCSNLFFLGGFRWIAKIKSLAAGKQTFPFALPRKLAKAEFELAFELAATERRRFLRSQQFVQNRFRNRFWRACYELQLDTDNLPLAIGAPLTGNHLLEGHSVVWQLQALLAHSQGLSMSELVKSGQVKLAAEASIPTVVQHLEHYLKLCHLMERRKHDRELLLELLYDNYCKNV